VIIHRRFSGVSADELDCGRHSSHEGRRLLEHWDVIQDEATKAESKSGLPMFGEKFTK